MEIRVLRYFLTVIEEEGFTAAADMLRMSQPTLSRQIQALEEEIGAPLFVRGTRGRTLELTEEGRLLRRRAEEIVAISDRTLRDLANTNQELSGDVNIGSAECETMRLLARAMTSLHARHPGIRFHMFDGNATDVLERVDAGMDDFGLVLEPADMSRFDYLQLPVVDQWVLMMRREHPLASRPSIRREDLKGVPLIVPRNAFKRNDLSGWIGGGISRLNVIGTTNVTHNSQLMVAEGFGCKLALRDSLLDAGETGTGDLVSRPLDPPMDAHLSLVWRKGQPMSHACQAYLDEVRTLITRAS